MPEIDGAALRKKAEAEDREFLQSIVSEYETLGQRWRDAAPYSQEVANLDATFKARERAIGAAVANGLFSRILALLSEVEALRADSRRFRWYFSDKPKGDWLMTYLDGVRIGWTTDEWRAAIDAALSASPPGVAPDNQQEKP
jgi:hypothetical protein